jgi:cytoskeleton protein RodZ
MSEFGVRIKHAREAQNVSLRHIATVTKISLSTLEALEREDFSRLPGGIFGRAFVRAYATEVGLDPDLTVQEFLVEYDRFDRERAARVTRPEVTAEDLAFAEKQRRAASVLRAILIGFIVLVLASVLAWQMKVRSRSASAQGASQSPLVAGPPVPVEPLAASAPAAALLPTPAPTATAFVGSPVGSRDQFVLQLDATRDCWVRVTVDGTVQFEQVLHAGDRRDVKPGRDVYLQVANAGSIRWTINGKPARQLGKAGQAGTARVTPTTVMQFVQ